MERLTKRNFVFSSHYVASNLQSFAIAECLAKLQEYENLEEDGRMFIPPCRLGDTLYMVVTKRPKVTMPEFLFIKTTYLTENNFFRVIRDFGKTVFLSREEAEAAMRKEETT